MLKEHHSNYKQPNPKQRKQRTLTKQQTKIQVTNQFINLKHKQHNPNKQQTRTKTNNQISTIATNCQSKHSNQVKQNIILTKPLQ